MLNVMIIVGSLRQASINKKLAHALDKLDHPDLKFFFAKIDDIPLYNQDLDKNVPTSVTRLKNEITKADGILLVTPEYNRSVPAVLKNVIDWGTRPPGQNSWAKKPVSMIGTSGGKVGTAIAQAHLRSIMVSINTILLGFPEVYFNYQEGIIDENFNITDENAKKLLQNFLDKFSDWVKKHNE